MSRRKNIRLGSLIFLSKRLKPQHGHSVRTIQPFHKGLYLYFSVYPREPIIWLVHVYPWQYSTVQSIIHIRHAALLCTCWFHCNRLFNMVVRNMRYEIDYIETKQVLPSTAPPPPPPPLPITPWSNNPSCELRCKHVNALATARKHTQRRARSNKHKHPRKTH